MKTTILGLATLALALGFSAFSSPAGAEVRTKEVTYSGGGVKMKGFLAWDDAKKGRRPGILVVHEWWGHNDYARRRAKMLAELGYTALAVDMYGDGKTADHPDTAGKFVAETIAKAEVAKARFDAAAKLLRAEKTVNAENIGAIGYCFGGGIVLEMARRGADLKVVASFHGSLGTDKPAEKGKVTARVLVLNGAADSFVSVSEIEAFTKEMQTAGADFRVLNYPGAKHSFTNPAADEMAKKFNLPLAYSADADRDSWDAMRRYLEATFGRKAFPTK